MKIRPAYILVIAATLVWGGTPAIMKLTLQEVPLFTLAFLRMSVASAIMAIIIIDKMKIDRKDLPQFFISALTGVTLNLSFFFIGLKLAPAINAALLVGSVPIFTLLAAHYSLGEKYTKRVVIAAVLALFGVMIIIGKPDTNTSPLLLLGNVLLLFSSLTWVFHEIASKRLLKKYDGSTVAFYTMAIGAFTFLPLAAFELIQNPTWINNVTPVGFAGIGYGILFASLFAYWAWQKGLAGLSAGQASFFFYLDPISGAILAILLLGEKLTPSLIFGGCLIAISVLIAEIHRKNHPLHK